MPDEPALNALLHPFVVGEISWPADGRTLFLRARFGDAARVIPREHLIAEQSFKPSADELSGAGIELRDEEPDGDFDRVLVLPPRQRDEARALLARAIKNARPGGMVVASMSNSDGARSGEADLERLAGNVRSLSKYKCRVFWTTVDASTKDSPGVAQWSALDAPRPIADGRFLSRPGLFAWDRIDSASALLAAHLPSDLSGRAADLGAGYGYLSTELLGRNPGIVAIDLYEAEARALAMARLNLSAFEARFDIGFHWHDVRAGLPHGYDIVISNPPFHQGRADQPELGQAFILAAAQALVPGGRFWLVANRHLPYEAILAERFASVRTVTVQDGFKVVEAVRGRA